MAKPRVIATLRVRDEADIILDCLDHHVKHGVDGFIITDNDSKDGTAEICRSHPACLQFFHQEEKIHDQGPRVTYMSRLACTKFKADWVLNIDGDEFWYGADSLIKIPKTINEIIIYKTYHHVITDNVPSGIFNRSYTPYHLPPYPVPPNKGKTIHRANRYIFVQHGNHRVRGPWRMAGIIDDNNLPNFYIHHYPQRSYDSFVKKCRNAGSKFENRPYIPTAHWASRWAAYCTNTMDVEYNKRVYQGQARIDALQTGMILQTPI